jgi:hypothetical protein
MIFLLLFPAIVMPEEAEQSETNANEFARRVLMNEAKAEAGDHSHWMLQWEMEKSGRKEIDEVVESKDGDLKWPLSIDGRQLTAAQKEAAERRIQQLLRDPDALRDSMRGENEDAARSQRMLKVLPNALTFTFASSVAIQSSCTSSQIRNFAQPHAKSASSRQWRVTSGSTANRRDSRKSQGVSVTR